MVLTRTFSSHIVVVLLLLAKHTLLVFLLIIYSNADSGVLIVHFTNFIVGTLTVMITQEVPNFLIAFCLQLIVHNTFGERDFVACVNYIDMCMFFVLFLHILLFPFFLIQAPELWTSHEPSVRRRLCNIMKELNEYLQYVWFQIMLIIFQNQRFTPALMSLLFLFSGTFIRQASKVVLSPRMRSREPLVLEDY